MVNWSELSLSGAGFKTINGVVYGYRTDISPAGDTRGLNIVGNPSGFSASVAPNTNIAYGRARNALRQFVYEALRNEADYTDAQARAWQGEILFRRINGAQITAPGSQADTLIKTWVPWTGAGGSQTNLSLGFRGTAGAASMGGNNGQLTLIAIQTPTNGGAGGNPATGTGHVRAWMIKPTITAGATGVENDTLGETYDKMTDAQIRTALIVASAPTAVAGTISVPNQTASAQGNVQRFVDLPAASGGTGNVTYAYSGLPAGVTALGTRLTIAATTASFAATTVTVTATWTSGSTTATAQDTFTLQFTRTPNAATGSWTVNAQTVTIGATGAGTHQLPAATGGTGTITYSLRTTGTGLSMTGRTINIPASYTAQARNIDVRATWTSGTSTAFLDRNFDFTVNRAAAVAVAGSFTAGSGTVRINTGSAGSTNIGAASGGTGTISYALRGTVPQGIFLSARSLGIAPTVPAGVYRLTVRATWTSGSTTAFRDSVYTLTIVRITVAQRGTFTVANKTVNSTIGRGGSFTIEEAAGGAGTLSYSLVSPPAGFSISGNTITIADSVAAGDYTLTARATWSGVNHASSATRDARFTVAVARVEDTSSGRSHIAWMTQVSRRNAATRVMPKWRSPWVKKPGRK